MLARPLLRLFALLPGGLRGAIASLAVALTGGRGKKRRRVARINLDIAFGDRLDAAQKERIALTSFTSFARCMLDAMALVPRLNAANWRHYVDVPEEDLARFRELLARGKGVLVMFSHHGNWELMGAAMAHMELAPVHVVARRQDPFSNPVIEALRTWTGNRVIYKEGAARATLKALRQGHIVGLSIDQNFSRGIFVPLFGVAAGTPDTLAGIARATGAPIVPLTCVPNAHGHYSGRLLPPIEPVCTDDKEADIRATTRLCLETLEGIIREYPALWMWAHKRWKSRPPEERPPRDIYGHATPPPAL
jgi:KDO2-lipid IV(A) lauroyltransferase